MKPIPPPIWLVLIQWRLPEGSKLPSPKAAQGRRSTPCMTSAAAPDFRTRGIGVKRLEIGRDGVRFCFKSPGLVKAFQARFGGERL
jgi:hypothetical protein